MTGGSRKKGRKERSFVGCLPCLKQTLGWIIPCPSSSVGFNI